MPKPSCRFPLFYKPSSGQWPCDGIAFWTLSVPWWNDSVFHGLTLIKYNVWIRVVFSYVYSVSVVCEHMSMFEKCSFCCFRYATYHHALAARATMSLLYAIITVYCALWRKSKKPSSIKISLLASRMLAAASIILIPIRGDGVLRFIVVCDCSLFMPKVGTEEK